MLLIVPYFAFSAAPAVALPASLLAQVDAPVDIRDSGGQTSRFAGPDGASPMDDVPVVPMIAGTASVLVVLSVIAVRRGWLT